MIRCKGRDLDKDRSSLSSDYSGRLSVGWVSDSGIISRPTILGIASASFGMCLNLLPLTSGFWSILLLSSIVGFSIGTSIVVMAVLVGDYAGKVSDVPVVLGLMSFLTGITGLGRPHLIGEDSKSVELTPLTLCIHVLRLSNLIVSFLLPQAISGILSVIMTDFCIW